MAALIAEMRQLCMAEIDSYKVGMTYYWSDNQIEDVLDRHQLFYNHVLIVPELQYSSTGTAVYYRYVTGVTKWEDNTGGTVTYLQDASGGTVTGHTFDANTGVFTFTANTTGLSYYVTGYAYDLNKAAAEIWRIKAAHASIAYDINTDNHGLKRSQLVTQALQMAQMYDGMAGIGVTTIWRSDVNPA